MREGEQASGFKSAFESGLNKGSQFTAMAGHKVSNTVRCKDKMNPFSMANNALTDKICPGRMVMKDVGRMYMRA